MKPRARKTDPQTSHAAAASAEMFVDSHAETITTALAHGAGTIYDIAARTRGKLDHVQVARMLPMMKRARGNVTPTDELRPSPSGRACRVWKLTEPANGNA